MVEVVVRPAPDLPAGSLALPERFAKECVRSLRLGQISREVSVNPAPAPAGELHLATDLFTRMVVPYPEIRMSCRLTCNGELELGPALAVLYTGTRSQFGRRRAAESADLYFRHLSAPPGLLALAFEQEIDWERATISGFVLDNRPGSAGSLVAAEFPIPTVVRLTWANDREIIGRLRRVTGERTFNWIRSIGKWSFHTLLSEDPVLREHLPETRQFQGGADLASMLVRHGTVFVKHAHGIKGKGTVRISRQEGGQIELRYVQSGRPQERLLDQYAQVMPLLKDLLKPGVWVVQQAISVAGRTNRAMHVRSILARDRGGQWRRLINTARVAPDERLVHTNLDNGSRETDLIRALAENHGMSETEAALCDERIEALGLRAAERLAEPYHPLGIVGLDLLVEVGTHRLLLLEANSVPGLPDVPEIERVMLSSQADYALFLTGFSGSD